jgi:cytochrome c peroxidase
MNTQKILLLTLCVLVNSCSTAEPPAETTPAAPVDAVPVRVALPEMPVPADNPITPEKVALGKQLFFDKRLSSTGMMSCETCHLPEMGWTDGKVLSPRFDGGMNTRHTPTLINVGYYTEWYWDGRATTLEAQILAAWRSQMGADPDQVSMTLNGIEGYRTQFEQHMGGPATPDLVTKALATFVRTLVSDNAPWDRYEKGDRTAVSDEVVAGFMVFSDSEKANCTLCHLPPLYTDALFHNVGVGYDKPMPDPGRGKTLADRATAAGTTDPTAAAMNGAFKTPTIRSITETGPYFHDGRSQTLEEAIDFMLAGGIANPNRDEKLQARTLTPEERTQLLAFLRSLTPESTPFERPALP